MVVTVDLGEKDIKASADPIYILSSFDNVTTETSFVNRSGEGYIDGFLITGRVKTRAAAISTDCIMTANILITIDGGTERTHNVELGRYRSGDEGRAADLISIPYHCPIRYDNSLNIDVSLAMTSPEIDDWIIYVQASDSRTS